MPYYNGKYLTDGEVEQISRNLTEDELDEFRSKLSGGRSSGMDSFVESAAIGALAGSAVLGGLLGGSFLGGYVGDELFDDD